LSGASSKLFRSLHRTPQLTIHSTGEAELRRVFERYGRVQTCIINEHKRHAFVKMASRADAVATRDAMERDPPDAQLRVSLLSQLPLSITDSEID